MKERMSASAMSQKKGGEKSTKLKAHQGFRVYKAHQAGFSQHFGKSCDLLPFYGIPMSCASYKQDLEIY
jgi:hypothetical protein